MRPIIIIFKLALSLGVSKKCFYAFVVYYVMASPEQKCNDDWQCHGEFQRMVLEAGTSTGGI